MSETKSEMEGDMQPEAPQEHIQEPQVKNEDEDMQTDGPELRPEAIFISGVNDMSQDQVKEYGYRYVKDAFIIEWINDHSLNFVFDTPQQALNALKSMTPKESKDVPREELKLAKPHPKLPDAQLQVRLATTADVKAAGAAHESAYYKKHGAPSLKERRIRFGTGRSEPMKYSRGDVFKAVKRNKNSGSTDLFPHLAKDQPADDLFPHLVGGGGDDLFPHLVGAGVGKNSGRKKNNRRDRRKKAVNAMEVEDLIPAPTGGSNELSGAETSEKPATVYSNMDY